MLFPKFLSYAEPAIPGPAISSKDRSLIKFSQVPYAGLDIACAISPICGTLSWSAKGLWVHYPCGGAAKAALRLDQMKFADPANRWCTKDASAPAVRRRIQMVYDHPCVGKALEQS